MRLSVQPLEDRLTPRAGDLDLSFGTNGQAAIPQFLSVVDAEVMPDSRIVLAGLAKNASGGTDFGVVRLLADGRPDPTFGNNGFASVGFDDPNIVVGDAVAALALRPDGGVAVAGSTPITINGVTFAAPALAVFNAAGQLDPAFKSDGKISFDWAEGRLGAVKDVAARPDGAVVVAGIGSNSIGDPPPTAVAARFSANGQFDLGYDGDGKANMPAEANSITLDAVVAADGGVVGIVQRPTKTVFDSEFTGTPSNAPIINTTDIVLVRLDPTGVRDQFFGTENGQAVVTYRMSYTSHAPDFSSPKVNLLLGTDGRPGVNFGGHVGLGFDNDGYHQLQADGRPALQTSVFPLDSDFASSSGESPFLLGDTLRDGRIYIASSSTAELEGLFRLTSTGIPDQQFGDGGFASYASLGLASAPGGDTPRAVAATPTGGAILVTDTSITRLLGDDPLPPVFAQLPTTIAVGTGNAGLLQTQLPSGSPTDTFQPFVGFTGSIRTATADFNGDGIDDLVAGAGPGVPSQVRVIDGRTRAELFAISPFESSFTGGVYVAAGDLDGDGVPELVITPDEGGGPRVRVFDGQDFTLAADFFGIDDTNFRGGARAAVGDVNGDGVGDLGVAAGFGGGPRVSIYDGTSVVSGAPANLFNDFFAFESTLRNGVFLALGDTNGDGFAEIIAGAGPGGAPRVTVTDGKQFLRGNETIFLANFFAGDANDRGGIRVAVKNLDGDARADLVAGSGEGGGSHVIGYWGSQIVAGGTVPAAFDLEAIPGYTGGVFVG